jgi:hypothetical protein
MGSAKAAAVLTGLRPRHHSTPGPSATQAEQGRIAASFFYRRAIEEVPSFRVGDILVRKDHPFARLEKGDLEVSTGTG